MFATDGLLKETKRETRLYTSSMNREVINFELWNLRRVRIVPKMDIRVLLHSSSNRCGCFRERNDKYANPKDIRVRVNTSIRPSDHLRQPSNTPPHP